jgi:isochorismate synthase
MVSTNLVIEEQRPLIDSYEAGDFFLASPYRTVLGKGKYASIYNDEQSISQSDDLPERVKALLDKAHQDGVKNAMVVGAIPFDYRKPVKLVVPTETMVMAPMLQSSVHQSEINNSVTYDIQSIPDPSEYKRGVEKCIKKMNDGQFDKIVLGRLLNLTSSSTIDVSQILHNLANHNPLGYTFAADITDQTSLEETVSSRKTLIGASPELLVSKTGNYLVANPLAGSRPRSEDPIEDQRRGEELLTSEKDLLEHSVVIEAVRKNLQPLCKSLIVPEKPSLVQTETMWHLSTEIKGEVKDPSISSLSLASALHPTPAVCGSPTELAREEIRETEPFDRGFFTGMIGWCDQAGNGEWVVTIRCAAVKEHTLQLFAGAGIVAASKPDEELAETSAKFRTMLHAMGLNKDQKI